MQELYTRGLSKADIEAGLDHVFGHASSDLAGQEAFQWALQDAVVLTPSQQQQARAGSADTMLCIVVHFLDTCRRRLLGSADSEKAMKRLEAWLLARQHSYATISLVREALRELKVAEQRDGQSVVVTGPAARDVEDEN